MARFPDPFFDLERAWRGSDRPLTSGMMPMDAFSSGDRFYLKFDLPGVDMDAIEITAEKNTLSVTVERHHEDTDEVTWAVRERPTGRHTRQVRITDMADFGSIEANYADGVLTVSMPMREEIKPRKIEVGRTSHLLDAAGV